jgi:phosphoribosyl transferase-like protein
MPMCSSRVHELALYQLDTMGTTITGTAGGEFDPLRYSRYKYGCPRSTRWFARRLADLLTGRCPWLVDASRVVVTSSPYHRVPTAARALAAGLRGLLNTARAGRGLPAAPLVHIQRQVVTSGDYGLLSAEDRTTVMAANRLSFHRIPVATLAGAHLVVVDDIKVTGAHQRCLATATDPFPLASRTFTHIAALAVPERAAVDPTVEDRFNHAQVSTLADLAPIVTASGFTWNVRVCKFVLGAANRADLPVFLRHLPDAFVRGLHDHSVSDGYHAMDAYRPSHLLVGAELRRRAKQPVEAGR